MNRNDLAALAMATVALFQFGDGSGTDTPTLEPKPAPVVTPVKPVPEPIGAVEQPGEPEPDKAVENAPAVKAIVPPPPVPPAPIQKPAPVATQAKPSPRYSASELKAMVRARRPGPYTEPQYAGVKPQSRDWAWRHLVSDHGYTARQMDGFTDSDMYHLHDLTHGGKMSPFRPDAVLNVQSAPAAKQVPTLVMTTGPGCIWCKRWMDSQYPKLKAANWIFKTKSPSSGESIPRFELFVGGRSIARYTGGNVTFETMRAAAASAGSGTQSAPVQRAAPQARSYTPSRTYQQPTRRGIFGLRR